MVGGQEPEQVVKKGEGRGLGGGSAHDTHGLQKRVWVGDSVIDQREDWHKVSVEKHGDIREA